MNFLQRLALRLISPTLARERQADQAQLHWERAARVKLIAQLIASGREYVNVHTTLQAICDQRDLALESLLALVARADDDRWTTVFDADTAVPQELCDYLDGLVARA